MRGGTISRSLQCSHCSAGFEGSFHQAKHAKYESRRVFCSAICRIADQRKRSAKPPPERGPCGYCGKMFYSRTAKQFCGMACYVKSPGFLVRLREQTDTAASRSARAAALRKGADIPCLECGKLFYKKRNLRKSFCSRVCYRSYLSKRFDRFIANPENLALPQCYDEFLDRDELTCLIEGCEWKGVGLSAHVNWAHSIQHRDLKRAAGFNLHTGLISRPLAEVLQARPLVGVASDTTRQSEANLLAVLAVKGRHYQYRSLEGAEHQMKARAILASTVGPRRICKGCGIEFYQSTPTGRTLFHSIKCRDSSYRKRRIEP